MTGNIHTTTPTASAALLEDDSVGDAPDAAAEEAADPDTDGVAAEATGIDETL